MKKISVDEVKSGFNTIFPDTIKNLSVEEDDDQNTFVFELELTTEAEELIIPDGIFIGFIDFNGKFVDGFIDGETFIDFIKEYK